MTASKGLGLLAALAGAVALGACGSDGDGDGSDSCGVRNQALVGSCTWADGSCGEYRGAVDAAAAAEDCADFDNPGTFRTGACAAATQASGGCVLTRLGGTGVMYDPSYSSADLEALCVASAGCFFGGTGDDGTGGTGGTTDECTTPDLGASLTGSCSLLGMCFEVRGGGAASDWESACVEQQGTWSGAGCEESYKASGACVTGMYGMTTTYYYGSFGVDIARAACADAPCGEFVEP